MELSKIQQLYTEASSEISMLRHNLKVNKDLMASLISQHQESEDKLNGEILILKKIISDHKRLHQDEVNDLKEQLTHTKDALEMKEYLLQEKENKWKEFEAVVAEYAGDHDSLIDKLGDIDYLWDEVASTRKITNVVQENTDLKVQIDELKSHISEVMSNITCNDLENPSPLNENLYEEGNGKSSNQCGSGNSQSGSHNASDRSAPVLVKTQKVRLLRSKFAPATTPTKDEEYDETHTPTEKSNLHLEIYRTYDNFCTQISSFREDLSVMEDVVELDDFSITLGERKLEIGGEKSNPARLYEDQDQDFSKWISALSPIKGRENLHKDELKYFALGC